ncbi:MAG: protein kinase [Gemmataceae bacterium]
MQTNPKDVTLAASAADRNETASAFETGRGAAPTASLDLSFLAAAQQPDEIGRLAKYRILSVLGHGGMGLVFRAEDPALRRQVAIKVMLPRFATDAHARARFIREAQAQAAVEHDHIVPIFGVNEGEPPFIVMPLLKGMTLADALKANAKPPLHAIVRIGREIAEGLAAAHESGLIHRDIKPANIWLEGSKLRVRILDFGLARAAEAADPAATGAEPLTADGAVVGTPMYMSPEQAKGEDLDCRTDLFSLGVILYQMVTGELPFTGKTTAAVLLAVVSHEPNGLANADIPAPLRSLIDRLLTKDRDAEGRPTAAAMVAEELRRIELGLTLPVVQVVTLDSVPMVAPAENPFAEIDTTAADNVPAAPVRERRPVSKAWVLGGVAAMLAVAVSAGVMFKMMAKSDPPVVKNDEPTPVPTPPKPVLPKPKESGVIPNWEQRKVLESVLEWGGSLHVSVGGPWQKIEPGGKLPATSFSTLAVDLKDVSLDDAKIERLRGLPPVQEQLVVAGTGVANTEFAKLAAMPVFASILYLDLSKTRIEGDGFAPLKNFPNLVKIDFTSSSVCGRDLVHIRGHKKLTWVSFHGCGNITDDGLEHLADIPSLTHVWFMYTNVTEKGVQKLAKLENLRYLHPGHCTDAIGEVLPKFPLLEDLHLGGSRTTGELLPKLAKLPKLKFIQMSELIRDEDLGPLDRFPVLTAVNFNNCGDRITDAAAERFPLCPRLTYAAFTKTKFSKAGAEKLSEKLPFCKIEYDGGVIGPKSPDPVAAELLRRQQCMLTLRLDDKSELVVTPAEPLPSVPYRIIRVSPPNDPGLAADFVPQQLLPAIAALPELESILDFWMVTKWTAADLNALAGMTVAAKLTNLRGDIPLTDETVAALKRLPTLVVLGCRIGPNSNPELLSELPNLKWVILVGEQNQPVALTPKCWELLARRKLVALELYRARVDDGAAKRIGEIEFVGEQRLMFSDCPGAATHLERFIKLPLRVLTIGDNDLTDADVPRLASFKGLQELNFWTNGLSEAGVQSLAEKLPGCKVTWKDRVVAPPKKK